MQEIRDGGLLLAVYGDCASIPEGRNFYGSGKEHLQWGTESMVKDTVIQPHIHKMRNRQFKSKTIEVFVVLRGLLQADIYALDKKLRQTVLLESGCFLVTYDGGHGFTARTDATKFIEVKLGNFTSISDDKEKF